jgi:hypothetical protein
MRILDLVPKRFLSFGWGRGKTLGGMLAYILAALVAVVPALPLWMRSVYRRTPGLSDNLQIVLLIGFHICLGLSVFLAFFMTWFTFWITYHYLAPYIVGFVPDAYFWESPLTPRSLVFLGALVVTPLFVFTRIGLLSLRDTHQVCKEQLDRVRRKHLTGFLWRF